MACSDVILRMGSMVSSFCNCQIAPQSKRLVGTSRATIFGNLLCASPLTKWNALLSGLTLCFSMYFIRLQFVYLQKRNAHGDCTKTRGTVLADLRVPPKVFHQRGVLGHLFDVLPVFICQMKEGLQHV